MRLAFSRRIFAALVIAVSSVACGSESPLAPSPGPSSTNPPPQSLPSALPGIWTGFLHAADCIVGLPCGPLETVPFTMRVATGGAGFIGSLEIDEPAFRGGSDFVLDIQGTAQADGSVSFTGLRAPLPRDSANIEVRRLVVRVNPISGLAGEIDVGWFYSGNGHNRHLRGTIASASYEPLIPTFSGSWSGEAIIRGCAGYCPIFQDPGDGMAIRLTVGQPAGVIAAQAHVSAFSSSGWLHLTGTRNGSEINLSGTRIEVEGGESRHLENFSASLDALGRMKGRFLYTADDRIAIAPFNVTYRLECELLWLKRDR